MNRSSRMSFEERTFQKEKRGYKRRHGFRVSRRPSNLAGNFRETQSGLRNDFPKAEGYFQALEGTFDLSTHTETNM